MLARASKKRKTSKDGERRKKSGKWERMRLWGWVVRGKDGAGRKRRMKKKLGEEEEGNERESEKGRKG